jgi:hypothetical protein
LCAARDSNPELLEFQLRLIIDRRRLTKCFVLCRFGTATSDPVTPPRSSTPLAGPWNELEVTAEKIRDAWVYTNDLGRIGQNRYL